MSDFGYTIFGLKTVELISLNYYLLLTLVAVLFLKLCYSFFIGEEKLLLVDSFLLTVCIMLCKKLPEFINGYLNTFDGVFGNQQHSIIALVLLISFLVLLIIELVEMYRGIKNYCS